MNKKTFIILAVVAALAVLGSIGYSFYKLIIQKDFMVLSDVSCDPETEGPCFVWVCEPDWWTACTGDPELDIWPYKVTEKMAYDVTTCDPIAAQEGIFTVITETAECDERGTCFETDTSPCETTYCDPETDGDLCFDPEKWDEYVATLRANMEEACGNTLGDYKEGVDYCSRLEEMDALLAAPEEEESGIEQGDSEEIPVEEEQETF